MKKQLGRTNLYINKLGFGGIPIQRITKDEAKKVVLKAIDEGINFFDTARSYTSSEAYLGFALEGCRENVIIATKSMARTYDLMKEDVIKSLNDLRTNYIDLYQFHNIKTKEELDMILSSNGAYNALKEAKLNNIIKYIGITSHSLDLINTILDSEYYNFFDTIQIPYNFLEPEAKSIIKKAKEKGIGTIAMKPLGGGYIDKASVAIKYLKSDDLLDVLIPGMGSTLEVEENVKSILDELNEDDLNYISELKKTVKEDFCHRCGYCLPCTKGIDIPGIFTLENYFDRYGLKTWAIERYNKLNEKASVCINCKACIKKCPYGINIPKRLLRIKGKFEN